MRLDDLDIEKLGLMMLGYSDNEADNLADTEKLDELLANKYSISFDDFANIVERLIEFTPTVRSALGNNEYHAFVKDGVMIVKSSQ